MNELYRFGPFELHIKERLLLRDGVRLSLPPKAFDLLVELVSNRGQLLTKDELMRRIWQDAIVEESNLPFNISLVRNALHDTSRSSRYIETIPKLGYRFVSPVVAETPPHNPSEELKLSETIRQLSPDFATTYNEAAIAERTGLTQLSVLGYRRALELLIKDYATKLSPSEQKEIQSKSIADCLRDYVDDSKTKNIVMAASWISNQQTHSIIGCNEELLGELKVCILILIHYIEMQMSTERLAEIIRQHEVRMKP